MLTGSITAEDEDIRRPGRRSGAVKETQFISIEVPPGFRRLFLLFLRYRMCYNKKARYRAFLSRKGQERTFSA